MIDLMKLINDSDNIGMYTTPGVFESYVTIYFIVIFLIIMLIVAMKRLDSFFIGLL